MSIRDESLLEAVFVQAVRRISQFTTQNLSNTVWAYATLKVSDDLFRPLGQSDPCNVDGGFETGPGALEDCSNFSPEEISEALGLQGFACSQLQATRNEEETSAIDVEATMTEVFGPYGSTADSQRSEGGGGLGVLVFTEGRYLACTRWPAAAGESSGESQDRRWKYILRDVLSGEERLISAAKLADYVGRCACLRVARRPRGEEAGR